MSVEFSLLGKDTDYPTQYQPELLFPIARAESRHNYAHIAGISQGKDWWHIFEISWLYVIFKIFLVGFGYTFKADLSNEGDESSSPI